MKLIWAVWLTLQLGGAVAASPLRRRVAAVDNEIPIHPIVIENLGDSDPVLADLISMPGIPENAAEDGAWSSLKAWPLVAIHAAVLPNGHLITYGAQPGRGIQDGRTYTFWDPKLGFAPESLEIVPNAERVDSFCSSGVLMLDGTFLVAGGKGKTQSRSVESSVLDYKTRVAKRVGNLFAPHWYGTIIKLADGRALMSGGGVAYAIGRYDPAYTADKISPTPEIYTNGDGWKRLDSATSLEAFGSEANRYWYPHQWVSATGTVFGLSTDRMWEMNLEGNASVTILGNFKVPPDSGNRESRPNTAGSSSAVMYDTGKILQMGGNGFANGYPTHSSVEATIIDITGIANGTILTNETSPMFLPRQWHNSMVLPNGHVLVVGGTKFALTAGENTVLDAEIWDPATGNWSLGGKASAHRSYHSVGILLPNGAVYTGGSGLPGPVANFNAEIYFPPYFFEKVENGTDICAKRPLIVSMSTNFLNYGDVLDLQVGTGNNISEISLSALPAVTHSFDGSQRRMTLEFVQEVGSSDIVAVMPSSPNLAPPGHYFLSVLNDKGVPSESAIVALNAASPPIPGEDFESPLMQITGAFTLEVNVRFDDIGSRRWQRIVDFSNGYRSDNIILGQLGSSGSLFFQVWRDNQPRTIRADNVVVQGEMANWKIGVNETGVMWIAKNDIIVSSGPGLLPRNVYRARIGVGRSSNSNDPNLAGLIDGLKITNLRGYDDGGLLNVPKQITGAFSIKVHAIFNYFGGRQWQRILDFGARADNIVFSQHSQWRNIMLEVVRDGKSYRIIAEHAIKPGELATWTAGVDITGLMWIEKNGIRIKEGPGVLPRNIQRENLFIGRSSIGAVSPLWGSVFGLEVMNEAKTGVPEQITGAFIAEAGARFDDLSLRWQRVFDFGNGPGKDNIILSQYSNTNSMAVEVWKSGRNYRMIAANAIIQGEVAMWKVGVNETGWMWLEKNGALLVERQAVVPRDVYRANTLFGESNWPNDSKHKGVILGHDIFNPGVVNDGGLLNFPDQISGEFSVQASARFDDLTRSSQRIFDFGNEAVNDAAVDNIAFGQFESSMGVQLEIWSSSGQKYQLIASDVLVEGEMAFWQVGVDRTRLMWIAKNGNRLAEGPGILPADVPRNNLLIGDNNWGRPKLDGVVLGLRVMSDGEGDPVEEIF